MFDAQGSENVSHPLRVVPLSQLARAGGLGLGAERSYIAPVLFWIAHGQGRLSVGGQLRGYTGHNAIFLPGNLSHGIEISPRCQGTAIFFAEKSMLPFPPNELHLRMQGVQMQSEMNALIEDLRQESQGTSPDRDLVLYHRAALMLLWLNRQAGRPHVPNVQVSDMLRAIAQPKR
ncbi:hypothetical protein [Mangrovicoccus algicola]|uniref:Uncharacterized protein n=1 Tax=Mangrovicoccus algicola TaxID=2771008 RepID=A0A8J6Z640_9RHOB|nr:hypothetical protein [Mangrovicoccus algicola]MBE3637085.1 hypothetical protein [Mangrovicoccus algicola]